jgi:hypothetical protein
MPPDVPGSADLDGCERAAAAGHGRRRARTSGRSRPARAPRARGLRLPAGRLDAIAPQDLAVVLVEQHDRERRRRIAGPPGEPRQGAGCPARRDRGRRCKPRAWFVPMRKPQHALVSDPTGSSANMHRQPRGSRTPTGAATTAAAGRHAPAARSAAPRATSRATAAAAAGRPARPGAAPPPRRARSDAPRTTPTSTCRHDRNDLPPTAAISAGHRPAVLAAAAVAAAAAAAPQRPSRRSSPPPSSAAPRRPRPGDTLLLTFSETVTLVAGALLTDADVTLSGCDTRRRATWPRRCSAHHRLGDARHRRDVHSPARRPIALAPRGGRQRRRARRRGQLGTGGTAGRDRHQRRQRARPSATSPSPPSTARSTAPAPPAARCRCPRTAGRSTSPTATTARSRPAQTQITANVAVGTTAGSQPAGTNLRPFLTRSRPPTRPPATACRRP